MSAAPEVTIVIPVLNQVQLTASCLQSLVDHTPDEPLTWELVVVDNGSSDETPELLASLGGDVTVIRNDENRGFGEACNQGAARSGAELVLFLNNDTEVTDGWLEALVATMRSEPWLGAVQPRLVFPDGRLNDAGGLMFRGGQAWSYGKHHPDPWAPQFCCRRAVDYATGACLLVRRAAFEEVGGFDSRYAPAYYEDADLSFALREAGWATWYEPASTVVHLEGGTAGTDVGAGLKRHQLINKDKFVERWADELSWRPAVDPERVEDWAHRAQGGFGPGEGSGERRPSPAEARERSSRARQVLVIDPWIVAPDRSAGHGRLASIMTSMRAAGHAVTFFAGNVLADHRVGYESELARLGIAHHGARAAGGGVTGRARPAERGAIEDLLAARRFDLALIEFFDTFEYFAPIIRERSPQTRLAFDTVDVHHVRLRREYARSGDESLREAIADAERGESASARCADLVITCTDADAAAIRPKAKGRPVLVVPTIHEPADVGPGFDDRRGGLFLGNALHAPNVDAVRWWADELADEVERARPGFELTVAGYDPNGVMSSAAAGRARTLGWVESTTPVLAAVRLSIAPLRFGAGMKGKVGDSLRHGVPVVLTSIAAEGMGLRHRETAMIADDARSFADAIAELHDDPELWLKLRHQGAAHIQHLCGPEVLDRALTGVLRAVGLGAAVEDAG